MTTIREVKESELPQGVDEIIAYTVDTTPWGGYTSDAAVILKDSDGEDVSGDNLSGAPSEAADVITTPLVYGLTAGENYRLEILWVYSGNTFETFLTLMAEV
jgi:hypothetical protein